MPETDIYQRVSTACAISGGQVESVAALIDEGGTVPFIARYRKERTGGLDEVAIQKVCDALESGREFDKRREAILGSLTEHGLLTDALRRDQDQALSGLPRLFFILEGPCGAVVQESVADGYSRLLAPSLETNASRTGLLMRQDSCRLPSAAALRMASA